MGVGQMMTAKTAQISRQFSADDMDGTVIEEKIDHDADAVGQGPWFHLNALARQSPFHPRGEGRRGCLSVCMI